MVLLSSDYPLDCIQATGTCQDKPKREPWETDEAYAKRLPKAIEVPKGNAGKKAYQSKWPN